MTSPEATPATASDRTVMRQQLGRPVRGLAGVAHFCRCGLPDVATTNPRLPDGSPFPTLFYLTCPRANSAIGTLEASGLMSEMQQRLGTDSELARQYRIAHADYLERRSALGDVPEISGVSAGGMPDRVKCLHVLVAHALAVGPGVNPFGDEALELLGPWGVYGPCVGGEDAGVGGEDASVGSDGAGVGREDPTIGSDCTGVDREAPSVDGEGQ